MSGSQVFHRIFSAMHTRFSLVLPGVDPARGAFLADEVQMIVQGQERLMSRFDPHSALAELNRRAAVEAVQPPEALWELIQACREHWLRTGGAFDIAQTARTELWRRAAARGEVPSARERAEAAERCGFDRVELDDEACTVRFTAPGLALDLGGVGKGVALDAVVEVLRQRGVSCGFLSFGESSVAVLGTHPSGPHWPVGVADLYEAGRSWHTFELRDAAMSTSGNRGGEAHIVDPRTGEPSAGARTLSVACARAADAEVLSTTLLLVPAPERAELSGKYAGTEAIEIVYESATGGWSGRVTWQYAA